MTATTERRSLIPAALRRRERPTNETTTADRLGIDYSRATQWRRIVLWFVVVVLIPGLLVGLTINAKNATRAAYAAANRPIVKEAYDARDGAKAHALACARAWYTYDPNGDREAYDTAVAGCSVPGVASRLTGEDTQVVVAATIAGTRSPRRDVTVVDVDLDIVRGNTQIVRRVRTVVLERDGGYALTAPPTRIPRPDVVTTPLDAPPIDGDTVITSEIERVLEGFFQAYGEGSDEALSYYSRDGRDFDGLDGAVRFAELDDVQVIALPEDFPDANRRTAIAQVTWFDGDLRDTTPYQIALIRSDGRWYVHDVAAVLPPRKTEGR